MKVRISVGDVEIRTDGLELTKQQVVNLLREVTGLAIMTGPGQDTDDRSASMGFTAHLELDTERNAEPDLSEWFEDD